MEVMSMRASSIGVVAFLLALILTFAFPFSMADQFPATPASAPTSDGTAIDQGIAYVLMLVALAVTYFVH